MEPLCGDKLGCRLCRAGFCLEGVLLLVAGSLLDGFAFDRRGLAGWSRISAPCLRNRRTAVARTATGTWLGLVRGFWHRAGSDGDRDARLSAPRPRQAFAIAPTNPRSLVPLERNNPSNDERAASVGSSCRAGTLRYRLHLDDHPSAQIAFNPVMHAKDDDRSQAASNTAVGELVGTGGFGGYDFNAVRRNGRFAPKAAVGLGTFLTPTHVNWSFQSRDEEFSIAGPNRLLILPCRLHEASAGIVAEEPV